MELRALLRGLKCSVQALKRKTSLRISAEHDAVRRRIFMSTPLRSASDQRTVHKDQRSAPEFDGSSPANANPRWTSGKTPHHQESAPFKRTLYPLGNVTILRGSHAADTQLVLPPSNVRPSKRSKKSTIDVRVGPSSEHREAPLISFTNKTPPPPPPKHAPGPPWFF